MVRLIIPKQMIMEGFGAVSTWTSILFTYDVLASWTGKNPLEPVLPWTPLMAQHALWAFFINVVTLVESDFDFPLLRKTGPFFLLLKGTILKRCSCFGSIWNVGLSTLYFCSVATTRLWISQVWHLWAGLILVGFFFHILNIVRLLCCCHRREAREAVEAAAKGEKKEN